MHLTSENQDNESVQFMLAEFQIMHNNFWRNEESGEKRVAFFITLTGGVVAVSVGLASNKLGDLGSQLTGVYLIGVLGLLFFGFFTMFRMLHRNTVTDEYKRGQDKIRKFFIERNPTLEGYLEFNPFDPKLEDKKRRKFRITRGGLIETTALLNSIIVALMVSVAIVSLPLKDWTIGFGVVVGAVMFGIQWWLVYWMYSRSKPKQ